MHQVTVPAGAAPPSAAALLAACVLGLVLATAASACRTESDRPPGTQESSDAPPAAAGAVGQGGAADGGAAQPDARHAPAGASGGPDSVGTASSAPVPAAGPPDADASTAPVPAAVRPFPSGLQGTLVFQSDLEGRTKIYTLDLATGQVRALTGDQRYRDENPRWSPDGTRIAFTSNRAHYVGASPETGDSDFDLYTTAADGSDVRRVTTIPADERDPAWTPDGRALVYSSDQDSRGDLYRVTLADGRVDRLTRHFVGRAIMPTVSPDGTRVAFASQSLRAGQFWVFQIQVLDLATQATTALPTDGGSCWPSWRGDSAALAYVNLAREPSGLGLTTLASGARQRLVQDPTSWSYYPDWSPDNRYIAFSVSPEHHEGEDWDLALVDTTKPGTFVKLTSGRGNDRLPDWK